MITISTADDANKKVNTRHGTYCFFVPPETQLKKPPKAEHTFVALKVLEVQSYDLSTNQASGISASTNFINLSSDSCQPK